MKVFKVLTLAVLLGLNPAMGWASDDDSDDSSDDSSSSSHSSSSSGSGSGGSSDSTPVVDYTRVQRIAGFRPTFSPAALNLLDHNRRVQAHGRPDYLAARYEFKLLSKGSIAPAVNALGASLRTRGFSKVPQEEVLSVIRQAVNDD